MVDSEATIGFVGYPCEICGKLLGSWPFDADPRCLDRSVHGWCLDFEQSKLNPAPPGSPTERYSESIAGDFVLSLGGREIPSKDIASWHTMENPLAIACVTGSVVEYGTAVVTLFLRNGYQVTDYMTSKEFNQRVKPLLWNTPV